MDYWIYEDKVNHEAKVHRADCSHCKDGAGHGRGRNERDNWWRHFDTAEAALAATPEARPPEQVRRASVPRRSGTRSAGVTIKKTWGRARSASPRSRWLAGFADPS